MTKLRIFLVCMMILVGLYVNGKKQEQKNIEAQFKKSLTAPVQYASTTVIIPNNVVEKLKISQTYGGYYSSDKKFVVYYTGTGCPYGQVFTDAINSIQSYNYYQNFYNFYSKQSKSGVSVSITSASGETKAEAMAKLDAMQQESQQEEEKIKDFEVMCHEFCIVNPRINELFYFDGIGAEEAAKLPTLFERLKNW